MAFALLITSTSIGQQTQVENEFENVRPFRIGVKSGIPNLISANGEYVLPLLKRKFAISADYSKINMDSGDFGFDTEEGAEIMEQEFDYFEAGINYYFFKPGKGLYAGISYANYGLNGNLPNFAENENGATGDGYLDFSNNSVNIKAGAKWGGFFYFRPEVGYAFNPFPSSFPYEWNMKTALQKIRN
ncbi:hypothetical protein APR40_11890 [Salegentibacter salarius]|uniref:Outer membrane protein beta-barrel domain-containing protein n=2 Tax=Salegentibacter salarius TaxID=435906 RepID=A0A2N0TWD2_9FLAO|nr:hypothetical protein BHS39_11915 [Salegentibacter salarius]PKD19057.1 hypothetical protein APR40_11890 [Salegentibacter salarius]SLK00746.1 hypothetical protein SAMN05660445_02391 [Salegentibacter salarius]